MISGPYCGDSHPGNMTLDTPTVYVMFKSDFYNNSKGFSLAFSATGNLSFSPTGNLSLSPLTTALRSPRIADPLSRTRTQQRQATTTWTMGATPAENITANLPHQSNRSLTRGIYQAAGISE